MFYKIKKMVLNLCIEHNFPEPEIQMMDDPSNDGLRYEIDEERICINLEDIKDIDNEGDIDYYSKELFVKYLMYLEKTPKYASKVNSLFINLLITNNLIQDDS